MRVRQFISSNLGDAANCDLLEWLTGEKCESIPLKSRQSGAVCAIGSILSSAKAGDKVWGSGFIRSTDKLDTVQKRDIFLLRGPKSAKLAGVSCGYCDPGVLLPLVYGVIRKTGSDIAFIPHYADFKSVKSYKLPPEYKLIDITGNPKDIITKIAACKSAVSSSLHGIIIAEALGIPAAWIKLSNKVIGGDFKFQDYYEGSGRPQKMKPTDWTRHMVFGTETYADPPLYDIQSLVNSFPGKILNSRKKEILDLWA